MTIDFDWLKALPKAELHLHIDGSLEAQRMLQLAEKNKIKLPYQSLEDVQEAYNFADLQSFLDLYYLGASVLQDEEDFYLLMSDYLKRCRDENILHCEIMVEPQTYAANGISFDTFMPGFKRAIYEAKEEWGQSVFLILSLLKHHTEDECIDVLNKAEAYRDDFVALGMASTEMGNPPEKFKKLYELAKRKGYKLTTHAGEEGPPEIVWGSLQVMNVGRIDHGVRSSDDPDLIKYLVEKQIPLTVCPISNVKLKVFEEMSEHNIVSMLKQGVLVTINSDDPGYFGGYLTDNYSAVANQFALSKDEVMSFAKNSFTASYLPEKKKKEFLSVLEAYE